MAKIAFILLCHADASAVIAQAERLTATGDYVAIHFDRRGSARDYATITAALARNPNVVFAQTRVKCAWGDWSLVRATLNTLLTALQSFRDATHLYLISGDCLPIKSAGYVHRFLDSDNRDHIEAFDFFTSDWIKIGLKHERLIYRHWFNGRTQAWLFHQSLAVQKALNLRRSIPADIAVQVGSQWWCLRRATVEKLLRFCRKRPDLVRFFATTWIPDETFFQTLVRHLVPASQISGRAPTFKLFTDYGVPVSFCNDHDDFLLGQDALFSRKISPEATRLKDRLASLWQSGRMEFQTTAKGAVVHEFVTGRGRSGHRHGLRFWDRGTSIAADRRLFVIACPKWAVARRLMHAGARHLGIGGVEYLFDDATCPVPPLGGIERSLDQRNRHRPSVMRLIYDMQGVDRLILCLDPGNVAALRDLASVPADIRILDLRCVINDAALLAQAQRQGLLDQDPPPAVAQCVLPTLRHALDDHVTALNQAGFSRLWRLSEQALPGQNAAALAGFFDIDLDMARKLSETPDLFAD